MRGQAKLDSNNLPTCYNYRNLSKTLLNGKWNSPIWRVNHLPTPPIGFQSPGLEAIRGDSSRDSQHDERDSGRRRNFPP
jgi:hypothetical protein